MIKDTDKTIGLARYRQRGDLTGRKLKEYLPTMLVINLSTLVLGSVNGIVAGNLVSSNALSSVNLFFPVLVIFVWRLRVQMNEGYRRSRETLAEVNGEMQNSLSGIRVSKAFNNFDFPAPLWPIIPTRSPFLISKFKSLSAQKPSSVGSYLLPIFECGSSFPNFRAVHDCMSRKSVPLFMTPRR